MENIFFLILVAVVGLLRWLSQAAENKRNAEAEKQGGAPPAPSSTPAPSRGAPQSEEERIRKFFEALGVPTSDTPPPRVQPRPITPRATPAPANRKFLPVDPFPAPRGRAKELPSRPPVAPPPIPSFVAPVAEIPPLPTRETSVLVASARPLTTASEFDVQEIGATIVPTKSDTSLATLAARLTTSQGLREAIILREIFGPPRSMQPFHHRSAV